jgi:acyl carrier protein
VPKEKVTLQSNIFQDLDIDSIDAIDLLINLKKLTGKQISPEVFKQVQTVGDVVDALYAEVNK